METGYDISHLYQEARTRWLKPVEVLFILQNFEKHQLAHEIPQKPAGGSLYLFNKREQKFFRKDGHSWRMRRDQRSTAEGHERLKVGTVEALNCYYAHGAENRGFQRRSYWMLESEHNHIVLVHYRNTEEGRNFGQPASQTSPLSSSNFSYTPNSFATNQPNFAFDRGEFDGPLRDQLSFSSDEIIRNQRINHLDVREHTDEVNSLFPEFSEALRSIEHQLSLNEDETEESNKMEMLGEEIVLEELICYHDSFDEASIDSNIFYSQPFSDGSIQHHQPPIARVNAECEHDARTFPFEEETVEYLLPSPLQNPNGINSNVFATVRGNGDQQKFRIHEISPAWCYSTEGAKIFIIGTFLCDPADNVLACMFGDMEVPIEIIQAGVICCNAPPHAPGKVGVCITSGNGKFCSEIKELEYRPDPKDCVHGISDETVNCSISDDRETFTGSEELLLLVRFVQLLFLPSKEYSETSVHSLGKPEISEDTWNQISVALLMGTSSAFNTLYWILQEVLKDKLSLWVLSRSCGHIQKECSLSKKEQGIIHMAAGLGFEWALQPILGMGVGVNFRDFNGWTALHWAAKFGRERMVALLVASGASAGAVTDPTAKDPTGKTVASIAASYGHKGVASYLSQVALTSHLSSLVLEESEISKGAAALETDKKISTLSKEIPFSSNYQGSFDYPLAAVRSAIQAAARIQSAFRAHSFRKKQQKEVAAAVARISSSDYSTLENDIQGLSSVLPLAFNNKHGCSAALSIQKKFRGWKSRKDYLSLRQDVVKIQAYFRGYQVRKKYNVRWAVSILEKVILRWRRRGIGFREFQLESDFVGEKEDEEEILMVFRKQKVEAAINEAVSTVLALVDCPTTRQQYGRILARYREAQVELQSQESTSNTHRCVMSSYHAFSFAANQDLTD